MLYTQLYTDIYMTLYVFVILTVYLIVLFECKRDTTGATHFSVRIVSDSE